LKHPADSVDNIENDFTKNRLALAGCATLGIAAVLLLRHRKAPQAVRGTVHLGQSTLSAGLAYRRFGTRRTVTPGVRGDHGYV